MECTCCCGGGAALRVRVRELPSCVRFKPIIHQHGAGGVTAVHGEPPHSPTLAGFLSEASERRSPRSTSVISFVLNTTTNRRAAQPGPLPPRRNTERGERWLLAGIGPSRLYVGEAVKFSTIGEPPVEHGTLRKRSEAGCCSVVVAPSARHVPGWSRNHLCAPCPQHYSS